MTAAYEELLHVLDEREINYSTGEDQSIRTTIQGDVATYWTAARVEDDLFQVACFSPVLIANFNGVSARVSCFARPQGPPYPAPTYRIAPE